MYFGGSFPPSIKAVFPTCSRDRLPVGITEWRGLSKLEWAKEGESERQLRDVRELLTLEGERVDRAYVERWSMQPQHFSCDVLQVFVDSSHFAAASASGAWSSASLQIFPAFVQIESD